LTPYSEPSIIITEVGPRDGLQSVKPVMATSIKQQWIAALARAGLQQIEVGSFVPAKLLPQMADTAEIVEAARQLDGLVVSALVPNMRGAERAIAAGAHKLSIPISASRAHSLANVNCTPDEAIAILRDICARRAATKGTATFGVEVSIATAFGCTMEGIISEDEVMRLALMAVNAGADQVGLSDTVGYANPAQVRRMFLRLKAELGTKAGGAHFHNTRGQGLANVVAALEAGVTEFDSSLGGLGGCPYAPGATGNIVTEDLVFLLESMGLDTGIDIEALIDARDLLMAGLPGVPIYGYVAQAGLPKGFQAVYTRRAM
jgi:hydroxymethylglutaryl-CoA lyase